MAPALVRVCAASTPAKAAASINPFRTREIISSEVYQIQLIVRRTC